MDGQGPFGRRQTGLQVDSFSPPVHAIFARMITCDKCRGTMVVERAVDLDTGLTLAYFACLNCGRRKPAEAEPRPLTARS